MNDSCLRGDGGREPEAPANVGRSIVRGFFSVSAGNVASRAINFFTVIYLVRTLRPTAYGSVAWAQGLLAFGTMAGDLGLHTLGIRLLAQDRGSSSRIVGNVLTLRACLSAFAVVGMVGVAITSGQSTTVTALTALFGLSVVVAVFVPEWVLIGLQGFGWLGVARVVQALTYAVLVLLLVRGEEGVLLVPLATMAAGVVSGSLLWRTIRRDLDVGPVRPSLANAGGLVRAALPLAIGDFLIQLQLNVPILIVGGLQGAVSAGYFAGAFRLFSALNEIVALAFVTLYPTVAARWKHAPETLGSLLSRVVRAFLTLTLPVAAGGLVVGRDLVVLTVGDAYAPSALSFQVLLWGLVVSSISGVYKLLVLLMGGRQSEYLVAVAVGAGTSVALCAGLVPFLGPVGAALAVVSAEAVSAVAGALASRRMITVALRGPLLRISLSAALMGAGCWWLRWLGVHPLFVLCVGIVGYSAALFVTGAVSQKDIEYLRLSMGRSGSDRSGLR